MTKAMKMKPARRDGFTLVEALGVIVVLMLFAAWAGPRVDAVVRSRQVKDEEGRIACLPAQAMNAAVRLQTPVWIEVQGNSLMVDDEPAGTQAVQTLRQVDLGDALSVSSVQTQGQPGDMGGWRWTAYPDGSAGVAGIEFQEGSQTKSLALGPDDEARWMDGPLPEQSQTRWPAGQLAQRNQVAAQGTPAPTP